MQQAMEQAEPLLGPDDPPPAEIVNPGGRSRFVLICEHAGRAVPAALGDLGVPAAEFDRHIAWDVGAGGVSRRLSALLDAPLVLQPYSRLVVDCNRPFEAPDAIPEVSDTTSVPANRGLSPAGRRARFDAIHTPFHDAVAQLLDARPEPGRTVLVMVHSFTPQLRRDGVARPWHLGLLHLRDDRLARRLMAVARARRPGLVADFNEPYRCGGLSDFAVPVHGEARGLPYALMEIRNDLIATPDGQEEWAAFLAEALAEAAAGLEEG